MSQLDMLQRRRFHHHVCDQNNKVYVSAAVGDFQNPETEIAKYFIQKHLFLEAWYS